MKIQLLAAGTKAPAWISEGSAEYQKRMPRECDVLIHEIGVAKRSKTANIEKLKREEESRFIQRIDKNAHVIALDRSGKSWTTEQLADRLESWMGNVNLVQMLIGGPDGLSDGCLDTASEKWSLSPLTFPHFLVRVIVMEQLYRAWSVTRNHPYHK